MAIDSPSCRSLFESSIFAKNDFLHNVVIGASHYQ